MSKYYYVYILTNIHNTVLYTGVTSNLIARVYHHKNKSISSFSSKYNLEKLVYYESYEDIQEAIKREKQLKGGSRKKKIELINRFNHEWEDIYSTICSKGDCFVVDNSASQRQLISEYERLYSEFF